MRWLLKSEPDVFSIDDLARSPAATAAWDGVRNFQARNNLRAMRRGELAFFYHSNASPSAIVGVTRVTREAYPDPSQFDPASPGHDPASTPRAPRWFQVDVRLVERLPRPVSLSEVRGEPPLRGMELLRRGRLSVQSVTAGEWAAVLRLSRRREAGS